jgi:hypothetical protein
MKRLPTPFLFFAHGIVPDLATVWDQVDIMMCPIRAGAGVSIKVAESLFNRMPVIATTQAIRGFPSLSGPGLMIKNSAEDWIEFLNSSEADQLATQMPSEELRRKFDVDQHVQRLDNFINDVT